MAQTSQLDPGATHDINASGIGTWSVGSSDPAGWKIDGVLAGVIIVSTEANITLKAFSGDIPDTSGVRAEVIDDVTVRVVSLSTVQVIPDTVTAQLWYNGATIGTAQSVSPTSIPYDESFSSWATLPTEAQAESSNFGVYVKWEDAIALGNSLDGISLVIDYHPVYDPEERIYTRLAGYTALTDLTTQIHMGDRPQGEKLPAVTFERISGVPWRAMSVDANLVQSRFQINSYADDPVEAKRVAEQVKRAMNRWSSSSDYVTIDSCFVDNEFNQEVEIGAADKGAYWVGLDVLVNHRTS